jgi:diacylglycerol kinase
MNPPDSPSPSMLFRCLQSFGPAFAGLRSLFATQANARVHLVFAAWAVAMGFLLKITLGEWIAVLLCIALVFTAEALNTALEMLADAVHPEQHPLVGRAKDCAAAAVLVCALASAVIGAILFGPRLWALLASWI